MLMQRAACSLAVAFLVSGCAATFPTLDTAGSESRPAKSRPTVQIHDTPWVSLQPIGAPVTAPQQVEVAPAQATAVANPSTAQAVALEQSIPAIESAANESQPLETSSAIAMVDAPGAVPLPAPVQTWSVSVEDRTLREALARWAAREGWTFEPEHWAMNVDIPLVASAEFTGSFKDAVRELMSATEMSRTPAQPCFYSNQVLRVVAYTESCDRMASF